MPKKLFLIFSSWLTTANIIFKKLHLATPESPPYQSIQIIEEKLTLLNTLAWNFTRYSPDIIKDLEAGRKWEVASFKKVIFMMSFITFAHLLWSCFESSFLPFSTIRLFIKPNSLFPSYIPHHNSDQTFPPSGFTRFTYFTWYYISNAIHAHVPQTCNSLVLVFSM